MLCLAHRPQKGHGLECAIHQASSSVVQTCIGSHVHVAQLVVHIYTNTKTHGCGWHRCTARCTYDLPGYKLCCMHIVLMYGRTTFHTVRAENMFLMSVLLCHVSGSSTAFGSPSSNKHSVLEHAASREPFLQAHLHWGIIAAGCQPAQHLQGASCISGEHLLSD